MTLAAEDLTVAKPFPVVRVVICGSFTRDPSGLVAVHKKLEAAGCRILSPTDPHFVAEVDGFVLAAHELGMRPSDVENGHLEAIRSASFVWLHDPDGYVGTSASLELGFAHAIGVPIFSDVLPRDPIFADMVHAVETPNAALEQLWHSGQTDPGRGVSALQRYYGYVAMERGYDGESPQDTMLLITEEVGELARAIRRSVGLARAGGYGTEDVATELADVQLYLLHLANVMGIELADAITMKERENAERAAGAPVASDQPGA